MSNDEWLLWDGAPQQRKNTCTSCSKRIQFDGDGYPSGGRKIRNQLAYMCNPCVEVIMSERFWTAGTWQSS